MFTYVSPSGFPAYIGTLASNDRAPTRRHPLEPMRASLAQQGLPDASSVATMKDGDNVRYAGLVICRRRPGTAGGVVFMTLEDETGFVNAVIWESVFQRYSVLAKTMSF